MGRHILAKEIHAGDHPPHCRCPGVRPRSRHRLVHAVLRATPGPARGARILWDVDEHATLFIEPDAARAGAGRITFAGVALDSLLEHLAAQGIEHELIDTDYVKIPDPDGNAIAFAELPDADAAGQGTSS